MSRLILATDDFGICFHSHDVIHVLYCYCNYVRMLSFPVLLLAVIILGIKCVEIRCDLMFNDHASAVL